MLPKEHLGKIYYSKYLCLYGIKGKQWSKSLPKVFRKE